MWFSRAVVPRMRQALMPAFPAGDCAALGDLFDEAVPGQGGLLLVVAAKMAANVRQCTVLNLTLVVLNNGVRVKVKFKGTRTRDF